MKTLWKTDEAIQGRAWSKIKYEIPYEISKTLPDGCLVLDLGGGLGWFGPWFIINHKKSKVVCVDIEPRLGKDVTYLKANVLSLPIFDDTFDVVCAHSILHHVPDSLDECLTEVQRVLKPGGLFVIQEPTANNPLVNVVRKFFRTDIHVDDEKPFLLKKLKDFIKKHFTIEEVECFFLFSYMVPHIVSRLPFLKSLAYFLLNLDKKMLNKLSLDNYSAYTSIVARK